MGTMTFDLPAQLAPEARDALEQSSVAGGQDNMPYATQVLLDQDQMIVSRSVNESGSLLAPLAVDGVGLVMVSSGTLMERLNPYQMTLELARGKVNQVRSQAADWLMGGLCMSEELGRKIRGSSLAFSKAVTLVPDACAGDEARIALEQGFHAADLLVEAYMRQVFEVRHLRQPRLDTAFACRLFPGFLGTEQEATFAKTFNAVCLPFSWDAIEKTEGQYKWDDYDRLVNWAADSGMSIIGGPLADFTGRGLPPWLWEKEADLATVCAHLSEYVSRAVERYQEKIRTWQIAAAGNWTGVIASGDNELLWLIVRLADVVRRSDPKLEIIVGIAQPWGDYLAHQERGQSPFAFTDQLVRTGIKPAALDLEVVMGVSPRGSYCRDLLDVSRVLDLYALLGVPLQVTIGYPSDTGADVHADPDQKTSAGYWRTGFSRGVQAEWAASFAQLCVCKPYVRAVHWAHFADAQPHLLPHCGLIDAAGRAKPALEKLAAIRSEHLK